MATRTLGAGRARRTARPDDASPSPAGSSIREVCLLALAGPGRAGPGDRLDWAGRAYRVAGRDGPRHVHLEPADAPEAASA